MVVGGEMPHRRMPARKSAPRWDKFWLRIRRNWQLYVLLALPLIWLVVFRYAPMYGAQIAFRQYSPAFGIEGSPWVGLANFERFLNSPKFEPVIVNTLVLSFYSLIAGIPHPHHPGAELESGQNAPVPQQRSDDHLRALLHLDRGDRGHALSVLASARRLYRGAGAGSGAIPAELDGRSRRSSAISLSGPAFGRRLGFSAIIYLAVLSTIDPALHEAAVVDGANRLQRIRYIDIPGLLPTAMVLLVLSTGRVLEVAFEKVYLMQSPLNLSVAEVINTYVYKVGLLSPILDFSYSTAIGLLKGVVGLLLMIAVNHAARRLTENSVW